MTACGVWLTRRGLVAVILEGPGRSRTLRLADTTEARRALALHLADARAQLVVDEALLEADPIATQALRLGVQVWVAGPPLLPSLRAAAGITGGGVARPSAALLARLPAIPWLRDKLRRLEPADDPRQISHL